VREVCDDLYVQTSSDGWFDGYFGQKQILLEDYSSKAFTTRDILQLFDGYSGLELKVKTSFQRCEANAIYITSHFHPRHYFCPERYKEIERRLSEVRELVLPPELLCNVGCAAEKSE
jgi:hypothetical protein